MIEIDYSGFDFDNPCYENIYRQRQEIYERLASDTIELEKYKRYYATNPWLFINHWATIFDAQLLDQGKNPFVPFVPCIQRQKAAVTWMYEKFTKPEHGVLEAAEGCGARWLAIYFAIWVFIFRTGVVGFGSTENNELDVRDNLDSVFQRILNVLDRDRVPRFLLPKDFWPKKRSYPATYANKRLENPVSGANIVGELSGDIGHGNYSVYFVLDSVFKRMNAGKFKFQRSIRTDCRIEISKGSRRRAHIQQRIEQFAGANQYFLLSR